MNLIDSTYFHDLTYVPELTGTMGGTGESGKAERLAKLNRHIARYEKDYLTLVLGTDIYTEFKEWINEPDTTAKWVALKAKLLDTDTLVSPIADYVFCPLWKAVCLPSSLSGTKMQKSTETEQVLSYRVRNTEVWNDMAFLNADLFEWLWENRTDYKHDEAELAYHNWEMLVSFDSGLGI